MEMIRWFWLGEISYNDIHYLTVNLKKRSLLNVNVQQIYEINCTEITHLQNSVDHEFAKLGRNCKFMKIGKKYYVEILIFFFFH